MNPEYFHTGFRCVVSRSELPKSFAVVTACNPGDIPWTEDRNRAADRLLAAELDASGLRRWRITGGSRDFRHREPGWGIDCGILSVALEIARRHGQDAVFWIEGDLLRLVGTSDEEVFDLGSWSSRTEFQASPESAGWIQDR